MFKRNLKRFVAIMLTAAMVIGSSAMAFGADGSLGGDEGEFEGWVNKKVFSVLVPTASANAFKMLIDPQGLIRETNAAAKEGLSANDFENGATVLFPRTTAGIPKYGSESDSISMANVGTVSVNYAVTAEVTGLDGKVTLSASENMAGIEDKAMLFMEMKKGALPAGTFATDNGNRWTAAKAGGNATDDAIVLSSNKAVEVSANWIQAVKNEYKVSYNEADGYTYGISLNSVSAAKASAYTDAFKVSFKGATNDGDLKAWKEAIGIKPVLTITYDITTLDADADEQEISGETGGGSERVMVSNGTGGYRYDFDPVVSGTLTSMKIDGTVRDGIITAGNATYSELVEGRFLIKATAVTNFNLATGDHTVEIVIGGNSYTLKIKN